MSAFNNPKIYLKAFEQLMQAPTLHRHLLATQDGLSLKTMYHNKRALTKALAQSIRQGHYCNAHNPYVSQGHAHGIQYSLTDWLLQEAVVDTTHRALSQHQRIYHAPTFSEKMQFVTDVASYLKKAHTNHHQVFYVSQYQLLVDEDSLLLTHHPCWQKISGFLTQDLLNYVYRPILKSSEGLFYQAITLKPQAARVKEVFLHADLVALDEYLLNDSQVFYTRVSGFLTIITTCEQKSADIRGKIHDHFLKQMRMVHLKKVSHFMLTTLPKSSFSKSKSLVSSLHYFKMAVFYDGSLGLSPQALKFWLMMLQRRLETTATLVSKKNLNQRGQLLSDFLNQFLYETLSCTNSEVSQCLLRINNQNQINFIDGEIAFLLASALTGSRRRRCFNAVPGWKIRQNWQLKTLSKIIDEIKFDFLKSCAII